ncbi:MAG: MFS transporter [Chloroflexi bacterium]|nr:MAG: MFS transporter [Chloroflexota bacterium]
MAQPLWGFASDRFGRIRVMRLSLAATAAGCALSALAPNLGLLIAARIVDGAAVCAILPTALVYVGDMVPFNARHAVIADVLAAVAIGTAAGSLGGGLFAHYASWRLVFGLTAVVAVALVVAMRRLPESDIAPAAGGPAAQIREALRRPLFTSPLPWSPPGPTRPSPAWSSRPMGAPSWSGPAWSRSSRREYPRGLRSRSVA